MTKVTRQPSGVTAGTMDDSRQTQAIPASAATGQAAGSALARRRHAAERAAKLDAKKAAAPARKGVRTKVTSLPAPAKKTVRAAPAAKKVRAR
ncbi:hypothetical protein FGE12_27375 [Aggregicoccus sp. 17bor-14]|uniref:hypothetical protein n=1 Tax=Myxococcaceae TaxID=31 RepID=UPI00129C4A29|nr:MULTISPECIES: hypothetical protein [Myxococcaceae]MBF5046168.1 hypothetical protein [Simulacricoccus sp. 17bor-14]MRI91893.1 hypothetical protein [Aggregicoccus sp. 17bor-14]